MLYLFYLAVPPEMRSKGYGAQLLCWLRENYPDKAVVGNIESTGSGAENEHQRIWRCEFYKRNGFRRVAFRLSDSSGLYDIISTDSAFDEKKYLRLIGELGFGAYHPHLLPVEWFPLRQSDKFPDCCHCFKKHNTEEKNAPLPFRIPAHFTMNHRFLSFWFSSSRRI